MRFTRYENIASDILNVFKCKIKLEFTSLLLYSNVLQTFVRLIAMNKFLEIVNYYIFM